MNLDTNTMSLFIIRKMSERNNMMELLTASQVSNDFGISTRMLRYYEQNGLLGMCAVKGVNNARTG